MPQFYKPTKFQWLLIFFIFFGIIFTIIGFGAKPLIYSQIKKGIEEMIIIDSTLATPSFYSWQSNLPVHSSDPQYNKKKNRAVPLYKSYYWFNYTNVPEILNGEKPHVQVVGPYAYRQWNEKRNIKFYDGGDSVEFVTQTWYTFDPEQSAPGLDPFKDQLTLLNSAYMTLLYQLGPTPPMPAEFTVEIALTGPVLRRSMLRAIQRLIPFVYLQRMTPVIEQNFQNILDASSPSATREDVLKCWGQCTSIPNDGILTTNESLWDGMMLWKDHPNPQPLILSSINLLFNAIDVHALNADNKDLDLTKVWAIILNPPPKDIPPGMQKDTFSALHSEYDSSVNQYAQYFNISNDQIKQIGSVLYQKFGPLYMDPLLHQLYPGMETIQDLYFFQWGEGNVLLHPSNQSSTPHLSLQFLLDSHTQVTTSPIAPEFALFTQNTMDNPYLTISGLDAREWLTNNKTGLLYSLNMGDFIQLALKFNNSEIERKYHIPEFEAIILSDYFANYTRDSATLATMKMFDSVQSGLWSTRPVHNWTFWQIDPMVEFIVRDGMDIALNDTGIYLSTCNYDYNDTTIAEALKWENIATYSTGKKDIHSVGQYTSYNGQKIIKNLWNIHNPVCGTDGTHFTPNLFTYKQDPKAALIWGQSPPFEPEAPQKAVGAWVPQLMRQVPFSYQRISHIDDITLWRHIPQPSQMGPNISFNSNFNGLWNVSYTHNVKGMNCFLSKPMFLFTEQSGVPDWWSLIDGLDTPTLEKYGTFLDVEPITGITMAASKKLQANIYLDAKDKPYWWRKEHLKMPLFDIMYPQMYVHQYSSIPSDQAKTFKSKVYGNITLAGVLNVVGLAIGLSFISIAILLYVGRWYLAIRQNDPRLEPTSSSDIIHYQSYQTFSGN